MQTASLSFGRRLLASAGAWLGTGTAVAVDSTSCGNPAEPAGGVTVDLFGPGMVLVQSTVTNSSGDFTFSNLTPADYVIQVVLPSGAISVPAIVQQGQSTTLTGELDLDCGDVDDDGNTSEPKLKVEQETEDGSMMDAEETEDGGHFSGDIKTSDGGTRHESGSQGDRSDEQETEDHNSSGTDSGGSSSDGSGSDGQDSSGDQSGSDGSGQESSH